MPRVPATSGVAPQSTGADLRWPWDEMPLLRPLMLVVQKVLSARRSYTVEVSHTSWVVKVDEVDIVGHFLCAELN